MPIPIPLRPMVQRPRPMRAQGGGVFRFGGRALAGQTDAVESAVVGGVVGSGVAWGAQATEARWHWLGRRFSAAEGSGGGGGGWCRLGWELIVQGRGDVVVVVDVVHFVVDGAAGGGLGGGKGAVVFYADGRCSQAGGVEDGGVADEGLGEAFGTVEHWALLWELIGRKSIFLFGGYK